VVNAAKYLDGQPILAVNPDPAAIEGVLLPFAAHTLPHALRAALYGQARTQRVTLAQATLADGQTLLGFNNLFIGARSHVSARYRLQIGQAHENQSSSGIIVATGAGSTGWLRSVYAGAAKVVEALGGQVNPPPNGGRFPWDAD
jgi:NAD kinase